MGFFQDAGNWAKSNAGSIGEIAGGVQGRLVGGVAGGLVGAKIGEKAGNQVSGGGPDLPQPPGVNPDLAELKRRQAEQARDFRTNIEGYKSNAFNQVAKLEKEALGKRMHDVRLDAKRRGLMFSGIRQGNEAKAQSDSSAQLAQSRFDINDLAEQEAQGLEADAIDSGVQQQKMVSQINDSIYNQAIKNMLNRRAGLSSLAGAGGTLVGTAAARSEASANQKATA